MHPAVRESTDNLYCSSVKNEWKENAAAGCFSSECCKFNLHLRSNIKSCLKSLIGQGFWGEGAAFLWILNCLFHLFHKETSLCLDSSCQSMDLAWKEQLWSANVTKRVEEEVVTVIVESVMDVCCLSVTYTTTYFNREPPYRQLYLLLKNSGNQ